ncbi:MULTISPECIES: serine hydrolase domain-containing protein [unclassified Inquilinus]|uniref:serine hydrolase domain-containing protein n=1 Tax=unclassified Inquilinus TaxID=2645927 RepID=UPI003F8F7D8C
MTHEGDAAVCSLLLGCALAAGGDHLCPTETFPTATWDMLPPTEKAKRNPDRLRESRQYSEILDTAAVVIVQCGAIVDEWGKVDAKLRIASVRKSLLSALIGTYIADGTINLEEDLGSIGLDDITHLTESEMKATVLDLLMSRPSIYLPEAAETERMKRARPRRGSHPSGAFWYYNNWDFNALCMIFAALTRRDVYSAFIERIARPTGMQDFDVGDYRYQYRKGSAFPAYHADMTARDLARFSLLYLREDKWRDRQIIPEWGHDTKVIRLSGS